MQNLAELRDFFDEAAARWAARTLDRALIERLVDRVGLAVGNSVVDLGGGTGHLLAPLRVRVGPAGRLCMVDLSPAMLHHAVDPARVSDAWRCCGVAERLPLGDGRWDAVIGMGMYPHLRDPAAALAEIVRVLVPGGRVAFLHLIGRVRLNELHGGMGPVSTHLLPPADAVAGTLAAAGLQVYDVVDQPDSFLVAARKPSLPRA